MKEDFPLHGIIGIVARSADEVQLAIGAGLSCVEIRADLLHDAGLDHAEVEAIVRDADEAGLRTVYTLRHPDHGGTFRGSESERAERTLAALAAGASFADLEWRSEASVIALAAGARLILSHHDFSAMPPESELAEWTQAMEAGHPAAIKVVPTAGDVGDAARMLNWVSQARADCPRIGFAMGAAGACSRVLCIAFGAPITYAAFGPAVAPGQLSLAALRDTCGADRLDASTRAIAIAGAALADESALHALRAAHEYRPPAHTFIPVPVDDKAELIRNVAALRIDAVVMDRTCGGDGETLVSANDLVA